MKRLFLLVALLLSALVVGSKPSPAAASFQVSLSTASTTVVSGSTFDITLTLGAPAGTGGEAYSTSNNQFSTVPVVVVPEGQTSVVFSATAAVVSSTTNPNCCGVSVGGIQGADTLYLTITPQASGVSIASKVNLVPGGVKLGYTAAIPAAVASATIVELSSDDPAVVMPATVTILAGQTKVLFNVNTTPVSTATDVVVSAIVDGDPVAATDTVTVAPPTVRLIAVPAKVTGGVVGVGTVTLNTKAPAGGWVVSLSDNSANVSVPATVTVPAGRTYAKFNITSTAATANYSVSISATDPVLPVTKSKSMTVIPATLSSISSSKISIAEGSDLRVVVNLTGPAAVDTVVEIYFTTNDKVEVTIPAGAKSRSGLVEAPQVSTKTRLTVYGKLGTVVKKSYVYVTNAA